jgi:hypothetical protein
MADAPKFFITPIIALGQVSAANTNRDGTGTLVDIATGATNGTRIEEIRVKATVTTTAGMVRLYIYDGSSVTRLFDEVPVAAATVSATVEADETIVVYDNLVLPSGYVLRASTHNAEAINVIAYGADA